MNPHSAEPASSVRAGSLSPDGYYYWSGEAWRSAFSEDGRWWWNGHYWVAHRAPRDRPAVRRLRLAHALQLALGAWIASVFLELFVFYLWFTFTYDFSDGRSLTLRWGVLSSAVLATTIVIAFRWLRSVTLHGFALAIRRSRLITALLAVWSALVVAYVTTDVGIAEAVRGVATAGIETRWQVLLSAGLGVAAAAVAIVLTGLVTHNTQSMSMEVSQ